MSSKKLTAQQDASAEALVEAPAPEPTLVGVPTDHHELLRHVAHISREHAELAAQQAGDSTSQFAVKRRAIADAIDEFLKLCEERGHRGIN